MNASVLGQYYFFFLKKKKSYSIEKIISYIRISMALLCNCITKSIRCPITIRNLILMFLEMDLISSKLEISFSAAMFLLMDKVTTWESLSIMALAIFILMDVLIASWMARAYTFKIGQSPIGLPVSWRILSLLYLHM